MSYSVEFYAASPPDAITRVKGDLSLPESVRATLLQALDGMQHSDAVYVRATGHLRATGEIYASSWGDYRVDPISLVRTPPAAPEPTAA